MAFIKWMCIVLQKFTKTLNLAAKHKADLLKSLCMLTHLNHAKDMIVADRAGDGFISLGIWYFVCAKRRVSTQSRPSLCLAQAHQLSHNIRPKTKYFHAVLSPPNRLFLHLQNNFTFAKFNRIIFFSANNLA